MVKMEIGRRDFMKYLAEGFVLAGTGLFIPKAYADVAPHEAYSSGEVFKLSDNFPLDPKREVIYGSIPANHETNGLYFVDYGKIANACPAMKELKEKMDRRNFGAKEIAEAEVKERVPKEIEKYGRDNNDVQIIIYKHLLEEKRLETEDLFKSVPSAFEGQSLDQIVEALDISDDIIDSSSFLEK